MKEFWDALQSGSGRMRRQPKGGKPWKSTCRPSNAPHSCAHSETTRQASARPILGIWPSQPGSLPGFSLPAGPPSFMRLSRPCSKPPRVPRSAHSIIGWRGAINRIRRAEPPRQAAPRFFVFPKDSILRGSRRVHWVYSDSGFIDREPVEPTSFHAQHRHVGSGGVDTDSLLSKAHS